MNKKVALARVISDIIKADDILDMNEMDFFSEMQKKHHIEYRHLKEAQKENFGEAVEVLKNEFTRMEKKEFIKDMEALTMVDGDCAPDEAFLVMALNLCLNPNNKISCRLIATDVTNISIDKGTIIYTELGRDKKRNSVIEDNLRYIEQDFNVAGLNFVYIPKIAKDFRDMDQGYLNRVVRFLAPALSEDSQQEIFDRLRTMTTEKFCERLLKNKMGLNRHFDGAPSLLFQVCRNADKVVYIMMALNGDDIRKELSAFVDMYKDLTQYNLTPIRHYKANKRFIYHGFHKAMFDLLAFPGEEMECDIVIDLKNKKVNFKGIDRDLELNAQALAHYMLVIHQSVFCKTKGLETNSNDKTKNAQTLRIFRKIYEKLSINLPDVDSFKKNLTPNLSKIRRKIDEIEMLANKDTYKPMLIDGKQRITLSPSKIYVKENNQEIPILESETWRNL